MTQPGNHQNAHSRYAVPLDDIQVLADIVCALDGRPETRALVERGHTVLRRALGDDAHLVYGHDDDTVTDGMLRNLAAALL